ncbi:chymotrypsin inhibitor i a b and c subunits, partial [Phtheirospermum japonicum]
YKAAWPELVGQPTEICKAQIEKDNPLITVVILGRDEERTDPYGPYFCCNRVYLFVDLGVCYFIPTVG